VTGGFYTRSSHDHFSDGWELTGYNTADVNSQIETLGIRVVSCFELPKRAFLPAGKKTV